MKARVKGKVGLMGWIALAAVIIWTTWPRSQWRLVQDRLINSQAIERLGMGGYLVFDTVDTVRNWWKVSQLDALDPAPFREFLRANAAHAHNPVAVNRGPGKHVVYLQLESMDGVVMGARRAGDPVMPFLTTLAATGVSFVNTIDNTASGRTTDGEFMVLTSQVPLTRPPVFVSQSLDKIPSLPRVLKSAGYRSLSMHGFNGAFWQREKAHRALGYDEMIFEESLELSEKIGWGWADHEMLLAAVDRLKASEVPLFLHMITLTNHHPYNHIAEREGVSPGTIAEEYLRSIRYVDDALAGFFSALDQAGLSDQCLVVIYGDHDSAVTKDVVEILEIDQPPLHPDTVPMVLWGFDRPAGRVEDVTGLQDAPVMVLEELGLDVPLTFLGNGWGRWGRTRSAQHGAMQSVEGALQEWTWPVESSLLTLMAINYPEKLLSP